MPYAQWHYPFENKDRYEREAFPADFIAEGVEQTVDGFIPYMYLAADAF